MAWFIFALLGALFDATYYMLIKKLLADIDEYVLASGTFLSGFVILILISLVSGFPEVGPVLYSSISATVAINIVAIVLYQKALKITDLSLAVPMNSFTLVFLIFTSLIMLNEFPSIFGIAGIFFIVLGSYILNVNKNTISLSDPFKNILKNRGVLYMLIVAFLGSITLNFDKLIVQNSDPIFGTSLVFLLLGLSFLGISFFKKCNIRKAYKKISINSF